MEKIARSIYSLQNITIKKTRKTSIMRIFRALGLERVIYYYNNSYAVKNYLKSFRIF